VLQHAEHAAAKKKKPQRSKAGHLKNVRPGELLTQPQIVQAMKSHEAQEKEKLEKKAADKRETDEVRKRVRAEAAAAVKKRKRKQDAPPARKKRVTAVVAEEAPEEQEEEGADANSTCGVM
jgi:hypothetical protein